jgi:hypothetical protein
MKGGLGTRPFSAGSVPARQLHTGSGFSVLFVSIVGTHGAPIGCSPEDPTRKWQHGASSKRARLSDEVAEASEPEETVRPTFGIERTHGTCLAPAGVFPNLVDCIGTPPQLSSIGAWSSISEFAGTVAAVKPWTSGSCEMLQCMPSAFMTRRGKMGEEGEKEKVVANFKEAFEKTKKACLVSVTLWEKNDGSVQAQVNMNNCLVL